MKKKQTKWLDNFGKAENANESNVSLPENFNGLAYDTSYRDYSPAWGGQFQQGGSIPGTVGFTYARTGSTPSEGKYAKKTLPSALNGKEMKFYQEGLDWKPKSMQYGGTEQISYNDPRYAELYKNRQVGSWSPQHQAFNLPDLDEVTVTAPRSYTMQSLRDATAAAMYGAPANVMKMESIPQALMTEGIEMLRGKPYDFRNVNPNFGSFTSNQRDPSMTMGYENPEGLLQNAANIGLSMIDPLLITGSKFFPKITSRRLSSGIEGTERLSNEIVGELLQGKSNRESIQKGNQWLQDWINHPATQSKIDKRIDDLYELRKDFLTIDDATELELIRNQSKNFKPNTKEYNLLKQINENFHQYFNPDAIKPIHYNNIGLSKTHYTNPLNRDLIENNKMLVSDRYGSWVTRNRRLPQFEREATTIHEGAHDWLSDAAIRESGIRNIALKNMTPEAKKAFFEWETYRNFGINPSELMDENSLNLGYLADPTEQHARIMELRRQFELTPDYKVPLHEARNALKYIKNNETFIDPKFAEVIGNDPIKLQELFNKFWAVPAAGVVAGSQALEQKRKGGIIKDNQGYWNPDNWGKIVEIDSNEITMKPNPYTGVGVPYDVLAFSDEGDVQYMEPGKDYKFKGSKVTEIPMAKLGINQLDAQPMKKLNQLLNFTNNPDKTNWLDKYQ